MTKVENGKCEKLMKDAIIKAKQSEEEYKEADRYLNSGNRIAWETEQRKADQHYGEAVGINQVLATLGFKNDRMKELSELL